MSALFILFSMTGCSSKKEKGLQVVTADLKREAYVAKTESDKPEITRPLSKEDSIRLVQKKEREERKNKTVVIDAKYDFGGWVWTAHLELAPDGILKGDADFRTGTLTRKHMSFSGSWRTGSISRGTSSLTYYELCVFDDEWYCTEELDYLWRGENAYSSMRGRDISVAWVITSVQYK